MIIFYQYYQYKYISINYLTDNRIHLSCKYLPFQQRRIS